MKIEMSDWLLFFFAHLNINNIILSSVVHAWLKVASIAKKNAANPHQWFFLSTCGYKHFSQLIST